MLFILEDLSLLESKVPIADIDHPTSHKFSFDRDKKERFRLINPDEIFHRIFSAVPLEWHLVQGKRVVAGLGSLPAKKPGFEQKGFFAKLKNFLTFTDQGIASAGKDHVLPAPVALTLVLLFNETGGASIGYNGRLTHFIQQQLDFVQ
ncbi:hypothetical protein [Methylomarinum vadi]|uniref:hypothetical protein n=1 Tax=Methylomarinum vadi TaxID=438855 RepID=UPI0004DEF7DB|nr:hypothetical protein [Methylomarinum vadi]